MVGPGDQVGPEARAKAARGVRADGRAAHDLPAQYILGVGFERGSGAAPARPRRGPGTLHALVLPPVPLPAAPPDGCGRPARREFRADSVFFFFFCARTSSIRRPGAGRGQAPPRRARRVPPPAAGAGACGRPVPEPGRCLGCVPRAARAVRYFPRSPTNDPRDSTMRSADCPWWASRRHARVVGSPARRVVPLPRSDAQHLEQPARGLRREETVMPVRGHAAWPRRRGNQNARMRRSLRSSAGAEAEARAGDPPGRPRGRPFRRRISAPRKSP